LRHLIELFARCPRAVGGTGRTHVHIFAPLPTGESMKIRGWNDFEGANGLLFYNRAYPRWLNLWLRIPVVDRFAYPFVVSANERLPVSQKTEEWMGSSFSYDPDRRFRKRRAGYRRRRLDGER
jgi:hypothetical protein